MKSTKLFKYLFITIFSLFLFQIQVSGQIRHGIRTLFKLAFKKAGKTAVKATTKNVDEMEFKSLYNIDNSVESSWYKLPSKYDYNLMEQFRIKHENEEYTRSLREVLISDGKFRRLQGPKLNPRWTVDYAFNTFNEFIPFDNKTKDYHREYLTFFFKESQKVLKKIDQLRELEILFKGKEITFDQGNNEINLQRLSRARTFGVPEETIKLYQRISELEQQKTYLEYLKKEYNIKSSYLFGREMEVIVDTEVKHYLNDLENLNGYFRILGYEQTTKENILKFQKIHKLVETGYFDDITINFINNSIDKIINLEEKLSVQYKYLGNTIEKPTEDFYAILEETQKNERFVKFDISTTIKNYKEEIAKNDKEIAARCNQLNILGYTCFNGDSYLSAFEKYTTTNSIDYAALKDALEKDLKSLKTKLNRVLNILNGDQEIISLIRIYSNIHNLQGSTLNDQLKILLQEDEDAVYIKINGDYKRYELNRINLRNDPNLISEAQMEALRIYEDANVYLQNTNQIEKQLVDIEKFKSWYLDKDEIVPICLTEEIDTYQVLKKNWNKKNRIVYESLEKTSKRLEKKIRKHSNKTLLVIGHVVDGVYVDEASNTSIKMSKLNALAEKYNCNILHIACGTALFDKKGTTDIINTYSIAKWLTEQNYKQLNFEDFIRSLSTSPIGENSNEIGLIIDDKTFEDKNYAQIKIHKKNKNTGGAVIGTATIGYIYWNSKKNNSQNAKNEKE